MSKLKATTIVCLNGNSQSGKDTFFEGVQHRAIRFAFADELKNFCYEHFGVPVEKFSDPDDARKQRDVWIAVGHAGRLATEGKMWVQKVATKIRMHILTSQQHGLGILPIVITDCGFDNEIDYIRGEFEDCEVLGVHIERPGGENPNDGREQLSDRNIDAWVVNQNQTKEGFQSLAEQIFTNLVG